MSDWKLLNTTTVSSSSASVEFTSVTGYKIFKWVFINVHASNVTVDLQGQFSTNGGSSYGIAKTSTFFRAAHKMDGSAGQQGYQTGHDVAGGTGVLPISRDIGTDNDANINGEFYLYNPASTTYVKHFYGTTVAAHSADNFTYNSYVGGHVDTTSAINAVKFFLSAGTIDHGIFKEYGLIAT